MTSTATIEIALPTGVFARIERVTFIDWMLSQAAGARLEAEYKNTHHEREGLEMLVPCLIARCVRFDDERWTVGQVLNMDKRDADALVMKLVPYVQATP